MKELLRNEANPRQSSRTPHKRYMEEITYKTVYISIWRSPEAGDFSQDKYAKNEAENKEMPKAQFSGNPGDKAE